jgi:hypothetical protein
LPVIARSPSALLRINSATKKSQWNYRVLEIASLAMTVYVAHFFRNYATRDLEEFYRRVDLLGHLRLYLWSWGF